MPMFSVKWNLADIKQDKPVKVFSAFACGGGSTMGYKRAGFEVIGNCEIDPAMNKVYVANNKPKYNYNMDVRDFLEQELPEELYDLDILDGSPPCSSFSLAGLREETWGKEKAFREGQRKQVLDDLFFVFLDIVEKLRPKVVIAENVVGLLQGKAKGYVNLIIKRFKELGYDVQLFKLNAAFMEVPQRRERVFFIANRMNFPKLKLDFHHPVIRFGEVRSESGWKSPDKDSQLAKLLSIAKEQHKSLADVNDKLGRKHSMFNQTIVWDGDVAKTLTAGTIPFRGCDKQYFSAEDIRAIQTFPLDYDFMTSNVNTINYICGMSVPPNMMAHIALEIWKQWLSGGLEWREV